MPTRSIDILLQEAHTRLGLGNLSAAETLYRQVIEQRSNHAGATHHLGVIALQRGRADEAIALMRRSVELEPGDLSYRKNLALAYRTASRFHEARQTLAEVIAAEPTDAIARQELGLTHDKLGQYEAAVNEYRRAIQLMVGASADTRVIARTYLNLGSALARLDRYADALAAADEAVRFRDDYPLAHMNRADALFRLGRLEDAWPEYEWRWKRPNFTEKWPNYSQPVWDGSSLNGRTLLLWHEQGLGDTVQFCRYAPLAAQRGGHVIVLCQPEVSRLLSTLSPDVEVIDRRCLMPPFDVHLPLMSLPRIFQTTMRTIPAPGGYLRTDAVQVEGWQAKLRGVSGIGPRVGIAWAGSPTQANDHNRSMPFATLAPLTQTEGIQFFSLQKGYASAQLHNSSAASRVVDWTNQLGDFASTAAFMASLDLIVTVDTSVCHVAGALGLQVWTLLTFDPDFRYICDRDQSSWYSSMRLFRQRSQGNWTEVVSRVALAIGEFAHASPQSK